MINEVSRRYARALYDLAKANRNADKVFADLRALADVFAKDKTISSFVLSPLVGPEQKTAALKAALSGKISEEVINTLLLLADKGRMDIFNEVVDAFELISDEDHGVSRGTVRSAAPLSAEARQHIKETVEKVTKKKVILNFEEDPKLLGGMVAQVGGWTFDDSLETQLMKMSESLNRSTH
jgi:F-type H+-transporting ATPase subunit delta